LLIATFFTIIHDADHAPKVYRDKLSKSKHAKDIKQIVAETTSDGKVAIYENRHNIHGRSKKLLDTFSTDQDDKIHSFVARKREELEPPNLAEADAIVKAINNE
jgi:hypothetical protein